MKSALNQWTAPSGPGKETVPGEPILVQGTRKPLLYSASRGISTTAKIFLSDNSGEHVVDAIKTGANKVNFSHIGQLLRFLSNVIMHLVHKKHISVI